MNQSKILRALVDAADVRQSDARGMPRPSEEERAALSTETVVDNEVGEGFAPETGQNPPLIGTPAR